MRRQGRLSHHDGQYENEEWPVADEKNEGRPHHFSEARRELPSRPEPGIADCKKQ
jgi:hypothetical protein